MTTSRPPAPPPCSHPTTLRLTSDADALVDGLAEAVDQLDRAAEDGWRLIGVQLVRRADGEYRLDARLAPPPTAEAPSIGDAKAA